MNTDLPLILHLYEGTASFSPDESLKSFFSLESALYTPQIDPHELLVAIILETKTFEKHHLESIRHLHALGKNIILVAICEGSEEYLRSASLITRCVTFPPHTQSKSLCTMILPMLREHVDSLRYMEALKLRSHRSGMVDSLNVVAHQWRQPINLISMEAINLSIQSTLEECVPSPSIKKSTQMISEQSQRMAEILKNVLNMGKTHRGREPFSINAMLERVGLFFNDQLQRERIGYQTLPLEEDKFLHGYASDLEEVLVNLIANAKDAFKTSPLEYQKSITIEATYSPTEILFHIKDNAGGIPESIREKIFEPHFSTKGQGEGFGIGLHIARLIITQEFKGNLTFCVSDHETVFTITLPRNDASQLTFIYS
ncbi:HAMP domain-containing sensor histidine kinase [Sulfuricurvum sp.]|uniref:sensor histidine kinase n=1 Tax=Sulfuricurvum sp. TaxID=2025608 RepID=UPI002E2F6387|nr:HAMP domain-containing sensor histidine kinase [Sulfuricurvum sp.]HEX5329769.1 HAMP domain-containing sensor histidine kinase [Sulfuricurvum sp.]